MEFLKSNWSTLLLVGILAGYLGISMGTNNCPMCVVGTSIGNYFGVGLEDNQAESADTTKTVKWEAECLNGDLVNSDNTKGRVSVVVYWASWCGPCRKEVPSLVALRKQFPKEQLEIVGISMDESKMEIERFIETFGINYEIALNNKSLEAAFGRIKYLPTMFIIDKEGSIQQQYTGLISSKVLEEQVQMLIDKKT